MKASSLCVKYLSIMAMAVDMLYDLSSSLIADSTCSMDSQIEFQVNDKLSAWQGPPPPLTLTGT